MKWTCLSSVDPVFLDVVILLNRQHLHKEAWVCGAQMFLVVY